jgi:NAD(P)-dependent dehydrogenase (short-subunit alcohol dehydrogenase family)
VDVRDSGQCRQAVDRAAQEFGRIDFLIANAGIFRIGIPVAEMTDEAWDDTLRTNLNGVFYMMRAVLPHMRRRGFGRIVVTSSQAGRQGMGGAGHYAASKWALLGLVKSVALENAKKGITVNAICPGSIATGIAINPVRIRAAYPNEPTLSPEEFVRRREAEHLGLMGITWLHPEEVANLGLFLLSEEGRFMTGEVVGITLGNLSVNSA